MSPPPPLETTGAPSPPTPPSPALVEELLGLKDLARAGWVRVGVPAPESVAAHSWGVALLAAFFCPPALDREKLLIMAILHDLAEVRVGDITPHDGIPHAEKHRREREAMAVLLGDHPALLAIWHEAEAGESPEARLLKQLDRMDLGVQARRYASRGHDVAELLDAGAAGLRLLDPKA